MALLDDIFDNLTNAQMEAIRIERTLNGRVRSLFRALFREIVNLVRENDPTQRRRLQTRLAELRALLDEQIEPRVIGGIEDARGLIKETIIGLAVAQVTATLGAINSAAGEPSATRLPSAEALRQAVERALIPVGDQQAPIDEWLDRLGQRAIERIGDEIRRGIQQGDDIQTILQNIQGTAAQRFQDGIAAQVTESIQFLVRTYANNALNEARIAAFVENADFVRAVRHVSILDNRTTRICIARSGGRYSVPSFEPIPPNRLPFLGGPPYHFRCRSTIVPDVRQGDGLQEPTFQEFLERQSEARQREILGARRWQLWRDGRLSLTDLIDAATGQPLTLEQLRERLGITEE